MSSLQDRMDALAAGDVVNVPGTGNQSPSPRHNPPNEGSQGSLAPDRSSDRRVSLG